MDIQGIQDSLVRYTVEHSGPQMRDYLGMSRIADCPLALYREMMGQRIIDVPTHLRFYAGYLWERDVKARLQAVGLYAPGSERELIAGWDARFRGHTDGQIDGALLEIKSTHSGRLDYIRSTRRIPRAHFYQVQCYLRHGGLPGAVLVYVARDTGALWVHAVDPVQTVAENLDVKARRVLAAVDARTPPACECGRCL